MLATAFGKVNIILYLQEYLLYNHIVVQYFIVSLWLDDL